MLSLNFVGQGQIDFPEYFLEDIPITQDFRGVVIIQAINNLTNVSSGTSNLLTINAYYPHEIDHPQSQPLNAPAVSATASGKPIFSATFGTVGNTVTANNRQAINVFNPPNSGVNFTFHSARCFTNDTTIPTSNLAVISGADSNYSQAVPAVSHTGAKSPPVSFAHCTYTDQVAVIIGSNPIIETMDMPAQVTQDMLAFPDSVTLVPGNNLVMEVASGVAGKFIRLALKWSEDISVPAQGGVPTSVATSLIQDGQPAGNVLVEATPALSAQGVLLTNNGNLTLAGILTILGHLSSDNGTLTTDGSGSFNAIGSSTTINGSVAGTLQYSFPFWGNGIKFCLVTLNGFNSTAVTVTLPSTMGRGFFYVGGLAGGTGVQFIKSGGGIQGGVITALATTGGTSTGVGPIKQNSFGDIFSTIDSFTVTTGGVASSAILLIGR